MTLLHLVSEQTMQNLLPLLALRPTTVVQVRSNGPRFHQAAENLKRAIESLRKTPPYYDLNPEFHEVIIEETSPAADRTRREVGEAFSRWPGAVVNLTGGTKPMSIGAYLAAAEQRAPLLYCDTHERRFLSLNERHPLPQLQGFKEIVATLNVEAVLAAHGRGPDCWRSKLPSAALKTFGTHAAAIRASADPQEFESLIKALRNHFRPEGKYRAEISALAADTALRADYFAAAAHAGLLNPTGGTPTSYSPPYQSKKNNEKLHKLLDGLWLELRVLDLLSANSRFHDPQWSVEPTGAEGDFGETDILCVDRWQAGLLLISCKSIAPGLEHFEALRRRSELFGGSHTQSVLCIYYPPPNPEECQRWAKSLHVKVLIGENEIAAFFANPS